MDRSITFAISLLVASIGILYVSWQGTPTLPSLFPSGGAAKVTCSPGSIPVPSLFGADILSLTAIEVHNHTVLPPGWVMSKPSTIYVPPFCNVTIIYTHPGWDDTIHVTVWLPSEWNGRFMGTGGGGFVTGLEDIGLADPVVKGYASVSTDGGHKNFLPTTKSWALKSPGNINWPLLIDFASRALEDQALLGKAITTSFYGTPPQYSYWSGCSTGGRQGLMAAQRYPDLYDGILATAPAIHFSKLVPSDYWAQVVMHEQGYYPTASEFEAMNAAAVEACDEDDGLVDGLISAPSQCSFNPNSVIGRSFSSANGSSQKISRDLARIAERIWQGPARKDGTKLWYGIEKGAPFNRVAITDKHENGTAYGVPFQTSVDWLRDFVVKDPAFDARSITTESFHELFDLSNTEYASIVDTNSPHLRRFRARGGKMITWHGLADELIPSDSTVEYYSNVLAADDKAHDYYRVFLAPGAYHCTRGSGALPDDALGALTAWVEHGTAPERLEATSLDGSFRRPLCPWPRVAKYLGNADAAEAGSFACVESY